MENWKLCVYMTRASKQIDFRLLGVTQSLKILTAFDNLLMFPQSARQMTTIKTKMKMKKKTVRIKICCNVATVRNFWPVQIAKSGQMFARLRFRAISSGGAFINPLARDNLINWKSGALFFFFCPPSCPTVSRGLLSLARPTAWLNDRFSPCTRVGLK